MPNQIQIVFNLLIDIREGKTITITLENILSRKDISVSRKVVLETEKRVGFSRRKPVPNDIIDQLAIRSIYLKENSCIHERKAIRTIIARSIGIRKEELNMGSRVSFGTTIPESGHFPEWFLSSNWTDIILLHGALTNITIKELQIKGREIINEVSTPLISQYPLLLTSDIQFLATGVSPHIFSTKKRRSSRISCQPIHRDDLEKLLEEGLAPDTELDGFCSLITERNNYPGLTRLFARAIWLTGMRTSEMFTCMVVNYKTGKEVLSLLDTGYFTKAELDSNQQVAVGWLEEFDQILDEIIASFSGEGGIRGLSVYLLTPKIANYSKWIDKKIRIQKLDGISQEDLKTILIMSCVRKLHLSSSDKSIISKYCSRILGDNSAHVFPDRGDRITFLTLRHAFMDEAMKSMTLKKACTLTGLTSKRTMSRYGDIYSRYKRNRQHTRWFPKPDKQSMSRIRKKLKSKWKKTQENDLRNTDHQTVPDKSFNEPKGKDYAYQPEPGLDSDNAIGVVNYFRKKVLGIIGKIEK
ncbi:MAG: hypothetical protein OXF46_05860 [Rhodobacteraceae bacterium]|nr:hypothetical protein [Paracoccaceae bacterium]